eukprot:COSAG02_NODE_2144_length_9681_cov_209.373304_8_plen_675_part_00
MHTNKLVQRCLLDDFDASCAEETAEADWQVDSAGHDHLDYARFTQSWFQLADLWTEGISADQYARFLEGVIECIAIVGPDGKLRLRNENEIRTLTALAREAKDSAKVVEAERKAEREAEREAATRRAAAAEEQARRTRAHWANPPKRFIPVYVPPEQRKATRVDSSSSRRRREVRPNVPITSTWLLDGADGVRPADTSMLWHVQGVAQPTHEPRRSPRTPASPDAATQARVRGERDSRKFKQPPPVPLTADRAVAGAKVDGKLSDDGSSVSNPGESAPTSPELQPEDPVRTDVSMLRRRYASSGRMDGKANSHSLAYSNVYVSVASGMNIALREHSSSAAQARTKLGSSRLKSEAAAPAHAHSTVDDLNASVASRPNTAPSARSRGAAGRPSTAPQTRSRQPVPPAVIVRRPVVTLKVPRLPRAELGVKASIVEPSEKAAVGDESGETDSGVTESERQNSGAGVSSSPWSNRPSTAPRRIEGSALRERAARKSGRAASSMSRPQTAPASSSKAAHFISVPGGKPIDSVISAHVGDSATPLSPTTRQRRLQAATPHYFIDTMGNARHLALDCSSQNATQRSSGSPSKGPYHALRMQARPTTVSARPPAGRSKAPIAHTSSARQRRMYQNAATRSTESSVAAPVQWMVAAPPPPWSRQQQGWSSVRRGGNRQAPRP